MWRWSDVDMICIDHHSQWRPHVAVSALANIFSYRIQPSDPQPNAASSFDVHVYGYPQARFAPYFYVIASLANTIIQYDATARLSVLSRMVHTVAHICACCCSGDIMCDRHRTFLPQALAIVMLPVKIQAHTFQALTLESHSGISPHRGVA